MLSRNGEPICQVFTTSSELSVPSRELLGKNRTLWAGPRETAFQKIKEAIYSASTLALYDSGRPTLICTDASFDLGGSLFQKQSDKSCHCVTFPSRSMTDIELLYAQIEKKILEIMWICERLADYLVGLQFHIHTDHKPLIYFFLQINHLMRYRRIFNGFVFA